MPITDGEHRMRLRTWIVLALAAVLAGPTLADDAPRAENATQRNVNQQERIQNGLESGQLNTKEAARLERQQTVIERTEAAALKDGSINNREQAVLDAEQDQASRSIYREKHDAQTGNPDSASSRRMQADVQRNVNQQARINEGIESGELTNREAARLEQDQARVTRNEAIAGADGKVTAREQERIQAREDNQSRRIKRKKNNGRDRD